MKRIQTKTRWIIIIDSMIMYENINQFVVLANSGEYFGGSHDNKQYGIHYIVASARNAYSAFTQRHELGHGLFHLGDEYNYSTVPVDE